MERETNIEMGFLARLLLAGSERQRKMDVYYTPVDLELKNTLLRTYATCSWNLTEALHAVGSIYADWDGIPHEQNRLSQEERLLLMRFGFLLQYISITFPVHTIGNVSDYVDGDDPAEGIHSYFEHMVNMDMTVPLYGSNGTRGEGYVDIIIMPSTLAHIVGLLSMTAAPESQFNHISGGGKHRLFFKLNAVMNESAKGAYKTIQRILQQVERTVNLLLLRTNYHFWKAYSLSPDQVNLAVLGSGFDDAVAADQQYAHTDMNDPQQNSQFPPAHPAPVPGQLIIFPVACIMALYGATYLSVAPGSWGCDASYTMEPYDVQSGHLFIFHGNLVHSGRSHRVQSWRFHWYRPLLGVLFDAGPFNLC